LHDLNFLVPETGAAHENALPDRPNRAVFQHHDGNRIPAMLQARQLIRPERFAFHSSRMRMNTVSKEELKSMDGESDRRLKSVNSK
jgi:hypothetical protein